MDSNHKEARQAQLLEHALRSTSFWSVTCLITGCFLGWPLLLALIVLLWGMGQFFSQASED
ncbi:hypothetical protein [Gimesia panareensis]|uniref:hypothetical protein n=1 Tax=Gimesia panareensis TaxID=2527978 RepID=UPI0011AA5DEF|nr:hypothetical protein [Gimesia panareensis]